MSSRNPAGCADGAKEREESPDEKRQAKMKGESAKSTRTVTSSKSRKNSVVCTPSKQPQTHLDSQRSCSRKMSRVEKPAEKLIAINGIDLTQSPKILYRIISYSIELSEGNELGVHFSQNMVVRLVKRTFSAYFCLLVGDQVIEINGNIPTNEEQLRRFIQDSPDKKCSITILRPWNMQSLTPERHQQEMEKSDKSNFYIIELYRFRNMKNGFEVRFPGATHKQQCFVWGVQKDSRASYSLKNGDRILDIDSVPVSSLMDCHGVKLKLTEVMLRDGLVTLLIERPNTLYSSSHPSLYAKQLAGDDTELGEDAIEIGSRESVKWTILKNRPIALTSILKKGSVVAAVAAPVANVEDDQGFSEKRGSRKKRKKKITIGKRTNHRIPSDVKPGVELLKVTSNSGLISFVRTAMGR